MRLTEVLWRQHIGRMIKRHWWQSGRKDIREMPTEGILASKGFKIIDVLDVAATPKLMRPIFKPKPLFSKPPSLDNTHPDWNEKPCLKYDDNDVLLEGTAQAQVLTKTERINQLPEKIISLEKQSDARIHQLVTRFLYSTHVFDAHQEKLPKKKNPLRPAFNYARIYGIPDCRKTHNLTQKLIQLCELISDPMIGQQRKTIENGYIQTYIERGNDLLYFESTFHMLMTSNRLLTPMSSYIDKFTEFLPDIHPLDPTISLKPNNIYKIQDYYPVVKQSPWINPHTIFVHFDSEKVKHITELPVTDDQIFARSLLKSFATAACCAKQKFGDDVMVLPEPVTVQCIQSNGKWFDFSVFQLNTLDIVGDSDVRNIWWSPPRIDLYDNAGYIDGRPTVEVYNPQVFDRILAFYRNV